MRLVHSHRLLAALILTACAGASKAPVGTSPQPTTGGHTDHTAGAKVRADSAGYPHTEADVRFMSSMIGHHAQALVMAGWAPTHGAGSSVRTLAERIINGQQDEIATMQQWLRDRGQPVPEPALSSSNGWSPSGAKMQGHEHHMLMPGMLTEAEMKQLDQAKEKEFDRLFLTFMIQHHKGAVTMVRDLFGSRGAAQEETVFKFANDVSVDQSTEIARMETMLANLSSDTQSP
jgi:uncharacterized protein (DUF305 family)